VKRELERIEIPGEHDARERAWSVVRGAYAEREPLPGNKLSLSRVAALAAAAVAVAAALTPQGRAVLADVRDAVLPTRVERAQPALFRLPAAGRLLVETGTSAWIVSDDGSKRRLGRYDEATWSPRGLFVAAVRGHQLFAIEPPGEIRWSLARPQLLEAPRWAPSGYRIAYRAGRTLRVVAGDGTGDRLLAPEVQPVAAPAWRPGSRHVLAYADGLGVVRVVDADTRVELWRTRAVRSPVHLEWSRDGRRLLVVTGRRVGIFAVDGRRIALLAPRGRSVTAAIAPAGRSFALVRSFGINERPGAVDLYSLDGRRLRRVFAGTGFFNDLAWSPNGRWLAVTWPTAGQWVFIDVKRPRRLVGVAEIADQFGGGGFPMLATWCCPS
jgi:hypothetical protein